MSAGLDTIAAVVSERTGLRIGPAQHSWLAAAVDRLSRRLGAASVDEALSELAASDACLEQLIDEVTVRETFFMRELDQLRSIDWGAALGCARTAGRRGVRIWSAGCASGEEAYTLAMLAAEAVGPAAPVSVLGTDISGAALECARAGWYTGRTVRRLDGEPWLARHFRASDGGVIVDPALRALVRFRRHNLVGDPSPPEGEDRFDVIVCRNLLIHLEPAAAERATAGLAAALQPGGTLLMAPADRLCVTGPALRDLVRRGPLSARDRRPPPVARTPTREPGRRRASSTTPGAARVVTPPAGTGIGPEPSGGLAEALRLADAGRGDEALERARAAAAEDPLDPSAHLLAGVLAIAAGSPSQAAGSLRRALYLDPTLAIAAFHLGRAREALFDVRAAVQAYEHALHALKPDDRRHGWLLDPVDMADVAEACKLRLLDLRGP